MGNQTFEIISEQSSIEWVGRNVRGAHNGTIKIKQGKLLLNDGDLIGGIVVVDTTSIKNDDIAEEETNAQFAGHLASDDFFSSQEFPEAVMKIISTDGNHVEADLTIKGITHRIKFGAMIKRNGSELIAKAKIIIDRTLYGMKFRSGNFFANLGDTLIYDDFELNVIITASAERESVSVIK